MACLAPTLRLRSTRLTIRVKQPETEHTISASAGSSPGSKAEARARMNRSRSRGRKFSRSRSVWRCLYGSPTSQKSYPSSRAPTAEPMGLPDPFRSAKTTRLWNSCATFGSGILTRPSPGRRHQNGSEAVAARPLSRLRFRPGTRLGLSGRRSHRQQRPFQPRLGKTGCPVRAPTIALG